MSARIPQKRKNVDASQSRVIKTTVSLDVATLAKLAALAALRGSSQSALAAEFIRTGLKGVVAFEKSGSVDPTHRPSPGLQISPDDEEAA